MTFNLEVKSMYPFKGTGYYWMIEKIVVKYLKVCATVEAILLVFSTLHMVESGFSDVHYLLSKHRSTFNIECGEL